MFVNKIVCYVIVMFEILDITHTSGEWIVAILIRSNLFHSFPFLGDMEKFVMMDPCVKVEGEKLRRKLEKSYEKLQNLDKEKNFEAFKKAFNEWEEGHIRLGKKMKLYVQWKEAEERVQYYRMLLEGW